MDPILYWNGVALELQRRDFTVSQGGNSFLAGGLMPEQGGPTRTSRALAIVHIAMYEAYAQSNPGGLAPYPPLAGLAPALPAGAPAAGAALADFTAGAISGAAAATMRVVYAKQQTFVAESLLLYTGAYLNAAFDLGRTFGNAIGAAVIQLRTGDGSELIDDMTFQYLPGRHRPDPFNPGQGRLSTHWGQLEPFAIAPAPMGAAIHTPYISAHPALGTQRYKDSVKDVRRKGAAANSTRTADETVEGIFWGYDGPRGLGVPPRLYNQVVRAFAAQHMSANTVADNARLYALVNVGMADAAIVAWSAKYAYDLWRPVVGIREHDMGFGPGHGSGPGATSTSCDPSWAPLGRPGTNTTGDFFKTPDFPAYPSGHATFGAVSLKLTAQFYAEKAGIAFGNAFRMTPFEFVSDEYNGVNMDPKGDVRPFHLRRFTLAEAVIQNALSRVWLGVHWRFDGIGTVVPDDLIGAQIPPDPAAAHPGPNEKTIGGVPVGLKIADEVFASVFK